MTHHKNCLLFNHIGFDTKVVHTKHMIVSSRTSAITHRFKYNGVYNYGFIDLDFIFQIFFKDESEFFYRLYSWKMRKEK